MNAVFFALWFSFCSPPSPDTGFSYMVLDNPESDVYIMTGLRCMGDV